MKTKFLFAVILLLGSSTSVFSQLRLNFIRMYYQEPDFILYFNVLCGNYQLDNITRGNIRIKDNGKAINDYEVWCNHGDGKCCISVSLVLDRSSSTFSGNPSLFKTMKESAKAFVDAMDGNCDEATLLSFSDTTSVDGFMTNDKVLLKQHIDKLTVGGTTAVWDAAFRAIEKIVNNGTQECKGVLLFSSGNDEMSCHTLQDVIAFAEKTRIRFYTIGIGDSINQIALVQLADRTGGKFYLSPSLSQIVEIYRDIDLPISLLWQCSVQYQAPSFIDTTHTIVFSILDVSGCPGRDSTIIKTFSIEDTVNISLNLGSSLVRGSEMVNVPLDLETLVVGTFPRFSFSVICDTSCIKLDGIEVRGFFLENIPITIDPRSDGYRISATRDVLFPRSGRLAELRFRTADVDSRRECSVTISDWKFESGKVISKLSSGTVIVLPRGARVACRSAELPKLLEWVKADGDYNPNPFPATFTFRNCGEQTATSAIATISFDTTKLSLESPKTFTQNLSPNLIDPTKIAQAQWILRAKPSPKDDSISIACTALFANHPSATCIGSITIQKAVITDVEENVSRPETFFLEQNYPNPFSLSTTIRLVIRDWRLESTAHNTLIPNPRSLISFKVFDLFGRKVLDLSDDARNNSQLRILNSQLPGAGMYFYRLTVGTQSQTKIMILMK